MKKNLWLAALVGVALTGCVNDESVSDAGMQKEMLFGTPALKTQTRANILGEISGTQAYADGSESFNVSAWTYQGAFADKAWDQMSRFFSEDGEVATKGTTFWTTATSHYWPSANYNVLFAAYSPAELNVTGTDEVPSTPVNPTITYDEKGVTIADFKVQAVADYQYDLMYSDYAADKNVTNNGSTAVDLNFNHALSSIIFSAQATKAQADITYFITKAELVGSFYTNGTFKQNIGGTAAWSYDADDIEECIYAPTFQKYTVTEEPGQFTSGRSAMLLIPQVVPAEAVVRLTYEKQSPTAVLTNTVDINLKDFIATDASNNKYSIEEWKPGYRYVYRVAFGENKPIFFNPVVSTWKEEPVAIYTISY